MQKTFLMCSMQDFKSNILRVFNMCLNHLSDELHLWRYYSPLQDQYNKWVSRWVNERRERVELTKADLNGKNTVRRLILEFGRWTWFLYARSYTQIQRRRCFMCTAKPHTYTIHGLLSILNGSKNSLFKISGIYEKFKNGKQNRIIC